MKISIKNIVPLLIISISITTIHTMDRFQPRQQHVKGNPPLTIAAWNGDKNAVVQLIESGADINAVTNFGRTALILAAYNGDRDIVKVLINNHADLNIRDIYGRTALMLAAWNGKKDIVQILVESGADKTITDKYGRTAFQMTRDQEIQNILSRE